MGTENLLRYAEQISQGAAEDVRQVARELIDRDRGVLAMVEP